MQNIEAFLISILLFASLPPFQDGQTLSPRQVLSASEIHFSSLPFFADLSKLAALFNVYRADSYTNTTADKIRFGVFGRSVSNGFGKSTSANSVTTVLCNGGEQKLHISTAMASSCTYKDSNGADAPCPDDETTSMVPVGLRADSFLAGYDIDTSESFVLNDAQVESYMGASDVIAFAIALSGTGMANKIPSTLYMINIEQDNPLAVQAVSDDGPLALSVMETLRYCDGDGCHAMTVAVDAVATASADDAAAAAVSVSFTRNSLIKKDGSPPVALNVAATATEFVAQATDSGMCLMY